MKHKYLIFIVSLAIMAAIGASGLAQSYESQGKRDPFEGPKEDIITNAVYSPPPLDKRPPGLTGLLVAEVTVAGLAANQAENVVILKGVDNMSYLARKGSKLFDGFVASISNEEVVFIRELTDPNGTKKTAKVVKRLYTEDK